MVLINWSTAFIRLMSSCMFDFNLPEPPLWNTQIIMQLWTTPGREKETFVSILCQFESVTWRPTSSSTLCQTYPYFSDEVTGSIRSSICIDPPLRITKVSQRHLDPSSTSYSTFETRSCRRSPYGDVKLLYCSCVSCHC